MSKFSSILAVCLITFTSFLVTKTLQIQHSCNPMIHSGTLPIECQVAAKDSSNTANRESHLQQTNNSPSREQPQIAQNISKPTSDRNRTSTTEISPNNTIEPDRSFQPNKIARDSQISDSEKSNPVTKLVNVINEHPDDIIGGVAGVAGGVATVAAAGATAALSVPVAGAVLIGLGIWFAIRTVF